MDVKEFVTAVGGGDNWGDVVVLRFPDVVASATAAYMERQQSEDRHNGSARALVLTPGFLWDFDLVSSSSQPALKVSARAVPLGTFTMEQKIEADEIGRSEDITSFEMTLSSGSGWSTEFPLGDRDYGPRQRDRSIEFVRDVLESQRLMSER